MADTVGIREVAAAAGVSVTTVSHALSGQGKVSEATRARVKAAAAQLGYAPNRFAKALRSNRSGLLGFVSEEIATTPFAGQILVGAQRAAHDLGLMLMIVNVDRGQVDDPQIDALIAQRVDSIIYASSSHRRIAFPRRLDPARTVLVDAFDPAVPAPRIVPDEYGIGLLATRHLLERGARDAVHVTVDEDVPAVEGRERGYRAAMAEHGALPRVFRVPGPADAAAGSASLVAMGELARTVSGIVAFNDQMAMGIYLAAGRRIPDDLSVVGVDDLRLITEGLRPALTTVALPHAEMGEAAVRMAAGVDPRDSGDKPVVKELPGRLIERESTRAPIVTHS